MIGEFHPPARILMGPGPSNIDPRVNLAMAKPLLGHLDPEFIRIMHQVQDLLRYVFATRNSLTIPISGTGTAYAFRDGQAYKVNWSRPTADSVLSLVGADGKPFPFKPGNTWVEVMGVYTKAEQKGNDWRFTFSIP